MTDLRSGLPRDVCVSDGRLSMCRLVQVTARSACGRPSRWNVVKIQPLPSSRTVTTSGLRTAQDRRCSACGTRLSNGGFSTGVAVSVGRQEIRGS